MIRNFILTYLIDELGDYDRYDELEEMHQAIETIFSNLEHNDNLH